MQPDPELERRWRQRVTELFQSAPAADGKRLDAVLASVRRRRVRARYRHRLAWGVAAAALLGVAGASAAWWLRQEPATPSQQDRAAPAAESREPASGDDSEPVRGRERETGKDNDGPVIYRWAQ